MKPLTGKYEGIIYRGEPWESRYRNQFRARRSVMLHAVNREWTLQDCEDVFLNHELWATGSDGRALGQREAGKRLRKDHEAASTYKRNNPGYHAAADARAHIGELVALAREWPWHGAAGRTDRDVLRFIHGAATWIGCDRINVASRDVSLGAGVSKHTATMALKRLAAAGWIEKLQDGKPGLAALYKLTRPARCPKISHITSLSGESYMAENGTPTDPGDEVWVRLGKTAMDLHGVLNTSPVSGREAGRRANVARSTADRVLKVLADHGLADRTPDGWVKGSLDLDRVAETFGWTGVNLGLSPVIGRK